MNCTEARRMVTPYVKHELDDRETEQFLDHVEHCKDCMEELDIYLPCIRLWSFWRAGNIRNIIFQRC